MAKQVSYGYSDTPVSGVDSLTLPREVVNYGADYRTTVEEPTEVQVTNLTTDLGLPEKFRWSISEVKDVYAGTGVEPTLYSTMRRGVSLLVQVTETWKVTDTEDPSYEVALPVSAHLVLKVPNNGIISAENVEHLVRRLVSGLFETGKTDTTRIAALLRGSLEPSDL